MHTLILLRCHCLATNYFCISGHDPCPACKSLLRVCESVCTCAQSESWSRADNTYPLLQRPEEREEKGATVAPQWAK